MAAPKDWEKTYGLIKEMRKVRDAPVDVMGSSTAADPNAPPEVQHFQVLVSALLSSQTRDALSRAALENLKQHGLTIENVIKTDEAKIAELIAKVRFAARKAGQLKKVAVVLRDQHDGKVPDDPNKLMKLPGLGPKLSYIIVAIAFGKVEGISVDSHVHRLCNQLGFVTAKDAEKTRVALQAWLPKPAWQEFGAMLSGLGQQLQNQQVHLLTKAMQTSDPVAALSLALKLKANVNAKHAVPPPEVPAPPHAVGSTALMFACQHAGLEVVQFLLQKGAKPSMKDANGDTAAAYAERREGDKAGDAEAIVQALSGDKKGGAKRKQPAKPQQEEAEEGEAEGEAEAEAEADSDEAAAPPTKRARV